MLVNRSQISTGSFRNYNLRRQIRSATISILFLLFVALPLYSWGQTTPEKGKVPSSVIEALAAGKSRDIIVLLDESDVLKEAKSMRDLKSLNYDTREILDHKAMLYTSRKNEVLSSLPQGKYEILKQYRHLPMMFVRIKSSEALQSLVKRPEVMEIFEDREMRPFLEQSLPLINQPSAVSAGYTGLGTTVAVLDTGVDYTRNAFGNCATPGTPGCKVVFAQDFTANDDGSLDDNGHGTNVAGIVLGVAPGTQIAALDVFDKNGSASSSDIIDAINWCIDNQDTYNIVAMNLSLGSGRYYSPCGTEFATPITDAREAGILASIASGNDGYTDSIATPACVPEAISVGAVYDSNVGNQSGWCLDATCSNTCSDPSTQSDLVTCFSNSAPFLTMLAPGAIIMAADIEESGTSQAAPHVAGAIAVLRSAYPSESIDTAVARLRGTGVKVTDSRNEISRPRLDLFAALSVADLNTGIRDVYSSTNLVLNQWGNVNVDVRVPDDGEYYVRVWDDNGISGPKWQWSSVSSSVVALWGFATNTFTLYVKPDTSSEGFEFWLYKKDILGLYKVIDKVQVTLTAQAADTTPPTVTSHTEGTNKSTNVNVNFSEDMDASTFTGSTVTVSGASSGIHACSLSFNHSTYELTIDPTTDFTNGEKVTVTIGTGVNDLAGNSLASPYSFTFDIETTPVPPTSISVTTSANPSSTTAYAPITISGTAVYNTGANVPTGAATITSGGEVYTAAVSNGAFSRSVNAPGSSQNISVSVSDGTLTGNATTYVTITDPPVGSSYNVTTDVIEAAWDDGSSCSSGCVHWIAKDAFRTTDPEVDALTVFTTSGQFGKWLGIRYKFYMPDGSQYGSTLTKNDVCAPSYYYWCYNYWGYYIKDNLMETAPGRYTVKFYTNENGGTFSKKGDHTYVVGWDFTEHRMAKDMEGSPNYLPISPTNTFYSTDEKAVAWANFDMVAQPMDIKWEFYEPSGAFYDSTTLTTDDPADSGADWWNWYRVGGWTYINGYAAAEKCGDWRVKVYVKNPKYGTYDLYYTDNFMILESPAVPPTLTVNSSPVSPIESQSISLSVSASDNKQLKKVVIHWNDGTQHDHTMQDNIYSATYSGTYGIGSSYTGGQNIEYWAEAWDTSGNRSESAHNVVVIQSESITAPSRPTGSSILKGNQSSTFSTAGGVSNVGHTIEYQFDWGDGTQSAWGSSSQSRAWSVEGLYYVKARARCKTDTSKMSEWSSSMSVIIDSTPPVLAVITSVPTPTKNLNPTYTFGSSEAGTATYGGSCQSATTVAVTGDNTIVLTAVGGGPLPDGVHSDCTITVTDAATNASNTLNINTFTVDTIAPTDGLLTATPGDTEITLSWSAATDTGSGLSVAPYKLVRTEGTTPPADCSGTGIYEGAGLTFTDTGLVNEQPYAYRLCATDAAGNMSVGATATATPEPSEYTLTVTKTGSGSGDVTDSQENLLWVGTTGSALYTAGDLVDLTATSHSCSYFDGWGDSCVGNTSPCSLTMDANRNVTAAFTLYGTAWNETLQKDYQSFRAAYLASGDGDVISVQAGQLSEDLLIDNPAISVTIKGGYDCDFKNSGLMTSINSLTITDGTVILDHIEIGGQ